MKKQFQYLLIIIISTIASYSVQLRIQIDIYSIFLGGILFTIGYGLTFFNGFKTLYFILLCSIAYCILSYCSLYMGLVFFYLGFIPFIIGTFIFYVALITFLNGEKTQPKKLFILAFVPFFIVTLFMTPMLHHILHFFGHEKSNIEQTIAIYIFAWQIVNGLALIPKTKV